MRSAVLDVMPRALRRSLAKLGGDIALARRRRRLTTRMMSERLAVSRSTYGRVEKGDPTVSLGIYAMAIFVLGFGDAFSELIDSSKDRQGLLLDAERLPRRVRAKKEPRPL
jgi:DNA-binding XRE family transcriptional regulator